MKNFLNALFLLLDTERWYFLLMRSALFLFLGAALIFRPAMSLHICACLSVIFLFFAMLFMRRKLPSRLRHLIWLLPSAGAGVFLTPRPEDTAAIWFAAGVALIAAFRTWDRKTVSSRIAAGAAFSAAIVFFFKSITGSWFDLYPAVSLSFAALFLLEIGNLKFSK